MNSIDNKKDYRQGLISVLGSSIWWGIMPIYWQWLKPIDSIVIIFYRIVLVALVCLIAALIAHKKEEILAPLKDKKLMAKLIIAGVIITLNWSLYIYAVNSENVIQSCIGYYIEPLVVCLFGMIFFGEKVNRHKAIALIMGAIGVVRDNVVFLYESPSKKHTTETEFDIAGLSALPKVSILYFSVGADPELLRFAAERADGLVIAGAGAGEFSKEWVEVINGLSIPVVISSRIDDGVITRDNLLCGNTVAANNLSPQKAAILLQLALTGNVRQEYLERLFLQY